MEVFWKRGYEAASLAELMEHMGIGKKSLYDTFGNKRSLFLKALDHYAQLQVNAIRAQLQASGSPLGNVEAVLRSIQQQPTQATCKGCMVGTNIAHFSTDDPEMAAVLRHHLRSLEDAFYGAIARAQDVGEIPSQADARDLARMLLCMTQGMALFSRILDRETLLRSAAEGAIALLKGC